jgi:hypothetical protein
MKETKKITIRLKLEDMDKLLLIQQKFSCDNLSDAVRQLVRRFFELSDTYDKLSDRIDKAIDRQKNIEDKLKIDKT